tara:strand:+ start:874 stop:1185 length:312 start_codon:yes stop_codon:yes gene_type:complete
MNRLDRATEWAEAMDEPFLCLGDSDECQDFAEAFIGLVEDDLPKAVYSKEKVIEVFVKRDGMTWEEAVEFFDFNVGGSYMGEQTPLFIETFEPMEFTIEPLEP